MARNWPHKHIVVGGKLESATLRQRVALRSALEALTLVVEFAPTLHIVKAVSLHIELTHTLIEKAGILCQREILLAGGTDTSSIQMAGNGAIATCVSVPTRHIHSPAETFHRGDVEQAGKLLSALLAEAL